MSKAYIVASVLGGLTVVLLVAAGYFGMPMLVFVAEITALVAVIILIVKLINWAFGRTRRPGNMLR
jgi:hypothetical protein